RRVWRPLGRDPVLPQGSSPTSSGDPWQGGARRLLPPSCLMGLRMGLLDPRFGRPRGVIRATMSREGPLRLSENPRACGDSRMEIWQDYEATYRSALKDPEFLSWRELGAQKKAQNIARVCHDMEVASMIEIGCGTGAVLRNLHAMNFAR